MKLRFFWLWLTAALTMTLLAHPVWGQNHVFEHFGNEEGLRSKSLYHCFQDSQLQMWFSSDYGVVRFDGQEFHQIGLENGMPEMVVLKVSEDKQGNLWFHTLNGSPVKYDGQTAKITWGPQFAEEMRGSNYISAFASLPDGAIVFGTQDGRVVQIMEDHAFKVLFRSEWGAIQMIEARPDGSLEFHFSRVNTLGTWKNDHLSVHSFQPLLEDWSYGTLRVVSWGPGEYIYAVGNRLAIVKKGGDTLKTEELVLLPERNILFLDVDRRGDLWVGTTEGALQFQASDRHLQRPNRFLKGRYVSSMVRDHEDGLWFTTDDGAFHCANPEILASIPLHLTSNDQASAIFASKNGFIYVGYLSGKLEEISRATLHKTREFQVPTINQSRKIVRILDGPGDQLFIAGYSGLQVLKGDKMIPLSQFKIADIAVEGNEASVCLYSNWCKFPVEDNDAWMPVARETIENAQAMRSHRCLHCAYDGQNHLWIATYDELIRIRGTQVDTIWKENLSDNGYKNALLGTLKSGPRVFGTSNYGLLVFGNGWETRLSKNNGLLDDRFVSMYEDQPGTVWILTSSGLSKAEVSLEGARVIQSIRLPNIFGGSNVSDFVVHNDTLWAATDNGFVFFPTQLFEKQPCSPKVDIVGIWANKQPQSLSRKLQLEHNQNQVRIQFHATTFIDPKNIEYRYRISNSDSNYQVTQSEYIELPSLSPGSFQIEIQARHPMGEWSLEPARISLEILAPFWKAWWFVLLLVLMILGCIALVGKEILANSKRKSALRESLAIARHNALINQMNPHFVFNSLNSIQNFVLSNETEIANNYLADFASLMRAILVNGRSTFITLAEEVRFLNLYLRLEALRLDQQFTFTVNVSKGLIASTTKVPTMMLQPILENAIWHGIAPLEDRQGIIEVTFQPAENYLACIVVDNGIGRKLAAERAEKFGKKHQSFATSILQERIELMNDSPGNKIKVEFQDLVNENGLGCGTKVTLFIPLDIAIGKENDQSNHRR